MGLLTKLKIAPNHNLKIVALTGAGVSEESGVPIFRGKGSMWENPVAKELASRAGPPWNTKGTWEFYEWRRALVNRCEPNAAHYTLVEMESYFENFWLITQNVDGLHRRAGSKRILELHGNMWKGRCLKDGEIIDLPETPLKSLPPYHTCKIPLRPHVVQFGEPVEHITEAINVSMKAELFFVIGTSSVVSPARDLPLLALKKGATVIEVNRDETVLTSCVNLSIKGKAAEMLPRIWKELKSFWD